MTKALIACFCLSLLVSCKTKEDDCTRLHTVTVNLLIIKKEAFDKQKCLAHILKSVKAGYGDYDDSRTDWAQTLLETYKKLKPDNAKALCDAYLKRGGECEVKKDGNMNVIPFQTRNLKD